MENMEFFKTEVIRLKRELRDMHNRVNSLIQVLAEIDEESSSVDYNKVKELATHITFGGNYLSENCFSKSGERYEYLLRVYIRILVEFIDTCKDFTNKEVYYSYVQWLLDTCRVEEGLYQFIQDSYLIYDSLYEEILTLNDEDREAIILDIMVLSYMENKNSTGVINHILLFKSLLKIPDDLFSKIMLVARYIVSRNDLNQVDLDFIMNKYAYYLTGEECFEVNDIILDGLEKEMEDLFDEFDNLDWDLD